jgi:hypothetical protein
MHTKGSPIDDDYESLSHTKWECKYHVVFIPKCRRKTLSAELRRQGRYAGRILNGERPADLPIIQSAKYELVINLNAAKAISLEFPALIRALANEVID